MSYNDYIRASKMGQKDYQSKLIAGEIPTLEALDDILHETRDYREVSIGLVTNSLRPDCRHQNQWKK